MASLAELRARIAEQNNRGKAAATPSFDNTIYPHWNIPENTTATIRFLPDKNSTNEFFWVERQLIRLPFNGVLGRPDINRVDVQVPCVEMWGEKCPVHEELRQWYKDESLKELANKYWKKRSYLYQGFVRVDPINEEQRPENPIRRFMISPQIFTIIKSSLMDPEIEELPTDYSRGLDFNVKKTMKANYADYSTSNWARKESALTEEELEAIDKFGLHDLAAGLPKHPGSVELQIIQEMFAASVDNKPYDLERWGSYYKPWGLNSSSNNQNEESEGSSRVSVPVSKPAPSFSKPVETSIESASEQPEEVTSVTIPSTPAVGSDKAQDILALIRARKQANG